MSAEQSQPQQSSVAVPQALVDALYHYVAAESAAIDGEWDHFAETHQLLSNTVAHLQNRTNVVESGIEASSKGIDEFLRELESKSEEVECTLSVLESVAASLDEYSKTLERAFPH